MCTHTIYIHINIWVPSSVLVKWVASWVFQFIQLAINLPTYQVKPLVNRKFHEGRQSMRDFQNGGCDNLEHDCSSIWQGTWYSKQSPKWYHKIFWFAANVDELEVLSISSNFNTKPLDIKQTIRIWISLIYALSIHTVACFGTLRDSVTLFDDYSLGSHPFCGSFFQRIPVCGDSTYHGIRIEILLPVVRGGITKLAPWQLVSHRYSGEVEGWSVGPTEQTSASTMNKIFFQWIKVKRWTKGLGTNVTHLLITAENESNSDIMSCQTNISTTRGILKEGVSLNMFKDNATAVGAMNIT